MYYIPSSVIQSLVQIRFQTPVLGGAVKGLLLFLLLLLLGEGEGEGIGEEPSIGSEAVDILLLITDDFTTFNFVAVVVAVVDINRIKENAEEGGGNENDGIPFFFW